MLLCCQMLLLAFCFRAVDGSYIDELSPQEQLLNKFFGPNRRIGDILPKRNLTDGKPLVVHFGYVISHIYDVKSNEEEIDLGIWISMRWHNELVSWNTSKYPVKYLKVPSDKVWLPQLYLVQNAISRPLAPSNHNANALIFPDGYSIIDFALPIKLICSMPACLFPADEHLCGVTINSLGYDRNLLLLQFDKNISRDYSQYEKTETGLWTLSKTPLVEQSFFLRTSVIMFHISGLVSTFTFTRKPGYYVLTVIGPIILICIATFCSVLLPWESGERTSLLITCFLALIVYLDTILGNVPKTSDYTPYIVWFVVVVLVFTILQIMFTALASYYAERANKGKKFVAPYKGIIAYIKKILFKRRKKEDAKIRSLDHVDYQDGGDDDVEVVRQYPIMRQNSRGTIGNRRKFSSGSYVVNKTEPVVTEGKFNAIPENGGTGVPFEASSGGNAAKCGGKQCKKVCKLIDRISVLLSASFMIFCPIFFYMLFHRKLDMKCK